MVQIINPKVGPYGDVFLANTQEFTGNNRFDLPLLLGLGGSFDGIIKFSDLAGSGFQGTLSPPTGGWTANRDMNLPDIGGQFLMVGTASVVAGGAPAAGKIGKSNLAGQVANISSTGLTNATPAGLYMVSAYIVCTSGGSGTATITASYTDVGGAKTSVLATISMATTGVKDRATLPLQLASGNITWTVTGYVSGTYAVYMRASFLG